MIYSERNNLSQHTEVVKSVSVVEKTYTFLDNLGGADFITEKESYQKITRTAFTINGESRNALFEHPNSEVVFKNIVITEGAELKFGIGINEIAWDKPGDGVLFEVRVVDEKLQSILIFSRYIDPKNNADDRKWFDAKVDLSNFAGQRVSFIFKTNGGPKGDTFIVAVCYTAGKIENLRFAIGERD